VARQRQGDEAHKLLSFVAEACIDEVDGSQEYVRPGPEMPLSGHDE